MTIPDQYTGQFDSLGAFTQPNEFSMNLQLSYDVSPRITITGTLANIVNNCWGGTPEAWTTTSGQICSFVAPGQLATGVTPVGNIYNPGDHIQPFVKYPYDPAFGPYNQAAGATPCGCDSPKLPFSFYLSTNIKI
jgi:hypothetical protein